MKFGEAQQAIRDLGHIDVCPLEVVGTWDITWKNAMTLCIKALLDCDAVLFLPCYRYSKGALLEFDIARRLEIPKYFSIKGKITEL